MQHYLIVWTFPTVEGSWESCPGFADYINAGGPGDCFEGFHSNIAFVNRSVEVEWRLLQPRILARFGLTLDHGLRGMAFSLR